MYPQQQLPQGDDISTPIERIAFWFAIALASICTVLVVAGTAGWVYVRYLA